MLRVLTFVFVSILPISAFSSSNTHPPLQGQLFLGGTGAAIGALKIIGKAFEEHFPGTSITVYPSLGSGGGVRALVANKLSIAFTSRPLNEKEKKLGLETREILRTPFIFVTHPDIEVSSLSLDEITQLFSGQTTKWPNGTLVRPVLRPLNDADSKIVMSISPAMSKALESAHQRAGRNVAATDYDSANELERISGSIGTTTMLLIHAEKRNLNILALNGVAPSIEHFKSGIYPFSKSIYAVTQAETKPLPEAFIKFLQSPEAQHIILKLASLPIN